MDVIARATALVGFTVAFSCRMGPLRNRRTVSSILRFPKLSGRPRQWGMISPFRTFMPPPAKVL